MSPDTRQHRGPHPRDSQLFGSDQLERLRSATAELSWLLSRGYKPVSSLKLVGDRHGLRERQRIAVSRAACADEEIEKRKQTHVAVERIGDRHLLVDGFNVIIGVEAGLSGGVLLLCRDESVRDLASVHGSYRAVQETERSILLVGSVLQDLQPASVTWLLDRPVSNSGRLAQKIVDIAAMHGWPWLVEVVFNPDARLKATTDVAVTSDSAILDRVSCWTNLKSHLLEHALPGAWVIDLRNPSQSTVAGVQRNDPRSITKYH